MTAMHPGSLSQTGEKLQLLYYIPSLSNLSTETCIYISGRVPFHVTPAEEDKTGEQWKLLPWLPPGSDGFLAARIMRTRKKPGCFAY